MILDYAEIIRLVRIRQKQIGQNALEVDKLNVEAMLLESLEESLAKLIRNEREVTEEISYE